MLFSVQWVCGIIILLCVKGRLFLICVKPMTVSPQQLSLEGLFIQTTAGPAKLFDSVNLEKMSVSGTGIVVL